MTKLLDTHYHLDFLPAADRAGLLSELDSRGIGVVAQTVLPSQFDATWPLPALGFHPWYITSPEQAERELAVFAECAGETRFIGEIGLDFSPRRIEAVHPELQRRVLASILAEVCGRATGDRRYVLSIHAVRAVTAVLELLDDHSAWDCPIAPVIHWFSGSSNELTRLIRSGGYISVNPRMLESKRGRAYVTQVPADRLLLETDLPASEGDSSVDGHAEDVTESLDATLRHLEELRGEGLSDQLVATQDALFGQDGAS